MSGYRSLKRVLGETNLERKCRWLFGICVGGLIFLAFTWVGWIAEDLIDRTARYKGHDLARIALYNLHWIKFETSDNSKQLQRHLTNSLAQETIEARLIKTDGGQEPEGADTPLYGPENEFEVELLRRLDAKYKEQRQSISRMPADTTAPSSDRTALQGKALGEMWRAAEAPPVAESFPAPTADKY